MTLNVDEIRKRLEKINSQGKGKNDGNLWKPQPNDNRIRILPYKENPGNPFVELYFHYNIGKRSFLCPSKTHGEDCPICELGTEMWNSDSEESKEIAKTLFAKNRTYVPMIERNENGAPIGKPKWWGMSPTIRNEFYNEIINPDCGDITDPAEGRDIVVNYLTPKQANNQYGKVSKTISFSRSKLADTEEAVSALVDAVTPITEIFQLEEYDKLADALENWLNPDNTQSSSTVDTSGDDSTTTETEVKAESVTSDDATKKFEELFGNDEDK